MNYRIELKNSIQIKYNTQKDLLFDCKINKTSLTIKMCAFDGGKFIFMAAHDVRAIWKKVRDIVKQITIYFL